MNFIEAPKDIHEPPKSMCKIRLHKSHRDV